MNKLTAEVFEEIVASLRSDRSLRSSEKRHHPRVGLRSTIDLQPCNPDPKDPRVFTVWVRDLSTDGLGIVGSRLMPAGMEFVAEFDRSEHEKLRVKYRVAYCKLLSRGLYSIGAKLVLLLPHSASTKPRKPIIAAR